MEETVDNVLFVTVDSLRYDEQFDPTDDLFPNGTVSFDRAFATGPGTTPSFPAMLTGTMPLSYGGLGPLNDDRPRVARTLRDAGLSTGGFQCNPFLSEHFEYQVGFDEYEDYQHPLMGVATKLFPRGIELNNPTLEALDETLHLTDAIKWAYQLVAGKPRPYVGADVVTDDAVDWLEDTDTPFFGWVHYMDVHHPCFPPSSYRRDHGVEHVEQSDVANWYSALVSDPGRLTEEDLVSLQNLYRAAIDFTRDQVARLLDQLEESGRLENTLVVFTSDHGELFGEHGEYGKPERMYDELLRVPLFVSNGPAYLSDAKTQLVSLLDIPPLIHDALGNDPPTEFTGRRPGVDSTREHVMAEHEVDGNVVVGARSAEWLYEVDEIRGERRLFDVTAGFERVPPDTESAELVVGAVHERLDKLNIDGVQLEQEVEGEIKDRLEDLGYV